ncbi:hypothetical protein EOL71_03140 [Candidatus Saccharibacteria bacterium]|nr:hypothetical protein [Candidatus Saccharibacteria bacterium]
MSTFKKKIAKITFAIMTALFIVGFTGTNKAEAATRGVSFVIKQSVYTGGAPIESSRIIVNGGTDLGGEPQYSASGAELAVPYQQARVFKVTTGKSYAVTGTVTYKISLFGPVIRKVINTSVFVPNGANMVWIE